MKSSLQGKLERVSTLLEHASSLASVDRLRAGPFPTAQEAAPIYSCISELLAEGQRIDAEIQRLHILHEEMNTQLRVVQSMVAPIRRLPNEILSEILTLVVCSRCPHERARAARDVAAVCTIWRATARDTRCLWTCVNLSAVATTALERRLDLHSTLSNGLLLHVCQTPGIPADAQLHHLLALLTAYTMRWNQLSLYIKDSLCLGEAMPDLPSLVRADIVLFSGDPSRVLWVLRGAPALQSLSINLQYPNRISPRIFVPALPCLTALNFVTDIIFSSERYILPVLRGCATTLQQLVLSYRDGTTSLPSEGPSTLFPALLSLEMHYSAPRILALMDTPVLETIAIRNYTDRNTPIGASLRHILELSTPRIRTLELHGVYGSAPGSEEFIFCLERLDGLTTLVVADTWQEHMMMNWPILARMTCSDYRPPILPALTTLSLHYGRTEHRVPDEFARVLRVMLRSRSSRRVVYGRTVEALHHVDTDLWDDYIDLEVGSVDA
ncbi:hypothetical protein BD626DRAFT_629570 [Schizophyllum amplum]|uniref:Uncharacterized protein n=1 Tax=Schizophyllum amplum TaxID=97359 RepID=A0A550CG49_9AGAR|nr:hypothetical protein BD626DRAFT_629570 [Auriculariopsis ampla]